MFRWLRERRKRRENEARKAREQLRRKAGLRPSESTFMESLIPDEISDGVAERYAVQLIAQASLSNERMAAIATEPDHFPRTFKAEPHYTPPPKEHELPVRITVLGGGGSGGTGHGASINTGGGGHSGHDSHSNHSNHSNHDSHTSYDSGSSYDSSSSSDGGGGW